MLEHAVHINKNNRKQNKTTMADFSASLTDKRREEIKLNIKFTE